MRLLRYLRAAWLDSAHAVHTERIVCPWLRSRGLLLFDARPSQAGRLYRVFLELRTFEHVEHPVVRSLAVDRVDVLVCSVPWHFFAGSAFSHLHTPFGVGAGSRVVLTLDPLGSDVEACMVACFETLTPRAWWERVRFTWQLLRQVYRPLPGIKL